MADLTNAQIAAAFEELADLYELDGAVQYRVIAYRNAARTVRDTSVSVAQLARDGRITDLPGIGKTLEEKVLALDETGDIPTLVKLRERIPVGLISVMHLPGFGPKRAKRLHDEIGVDSLDALRAAVEDGRLRGLRGFGLKAEENLRRVLAEVDEDGPARRVVLSRAIDTADQVVEALRAHPAADRVEAAGSLRRWADSVKDIDIIATTSDPAALSAALARAPDRRVRRHDRRCGRARDHAPGPEGRPQDRRAGPVRQRAPALHRRQGPQRGAARVGGAARAARVRVRDPRRRDRRDAALRDRGGGVRGARARLDPAGAARGPRRARGGGAGRRTGCRSWSSSATCAATCTATPPPPTASRPPRRWRSRPTSAGWSSWPITDHSATHGFGDHVTEDHLRARIEEIRALNERLDGFELLIGTETNILPDGSPDYPDDLLAELDWVIASVHTSFAMPRREMTARMVAAVEHPLVDALGHPTGRKIEKRRPYEVDMEKVIEAAARAGTMIEINGSPNRRDLNDVHARAAAEAGVRILVNSDAHSTTEFDQLRYGIATARRAWLTADQRRQHAHLEGLPEAPQAPLGGQPR